MQAFPLGEGAERREAEEVFHAGRFFPERDNGESKSPSSGFAELTHLPPRGKAFLFMDDGYTDWDDYITARGSMVGE